MPDSVAHLQDQLTDKPRHTKCEDASKQLPRIKLARVTFATLPILFELTHSARPMYYRSIQLACFGYPFQLNGALNHCAGDVYASQLKPFLLVEFAFDSVACAPQRRSNRSAAITVETYNDW